MDRNFYFSDKDADWVRSLSARRAWIEIHAAPLRKYHTAVALRKESVDRNINGNCNFTQKRVDLRKESVDRNQAMQIVIIVMDTSLSARRAWIEIRLVDMSAAWNRCRSPQGERG